MFPPRRISLFLFSALFLRLIFFFLFILLVGWRGEDLAVDVIYINVTRKAMEITDQHKYQVSFFSGCLFKNEGIWVE